MIITITKNGEISQRNIKNYNSLHSICNYRNNTNFELIYQWDNTYCLYGKKIGRIGYENIYAFPEPINETLFGTVCIVKKVNDEFVPLNISEWNEFYEKNMGIEINTSQEDTEQTLEVIIHDKELEKEEYEPE
jgi:hypothetical protein